MNNNTIKRKADEALLRFNLLITLATSDAINANTGMKKKLNAVFDSIEAALEAYETAPSETVRVASPSVNELGAPQAWGEVTPKAPK
jgi:hypothetical protein